MLLSWSMTVVLLTVVTLSSGESYIQLQNLKIKIDNQTLPSAVTPNSYKLKVHPNIAEGHFNGSVHINITCLKPTHTIVLHAHEDLHIFQERVTVKNLVDLLCLTITNITRNFSTETITVTTEEELQIGDLYELHFLFSGEIMTINTDYDSEIQEVAGFFRGSYENTNKQKKSWFAGIRTYLTYARRVFPCFDQPLFKSTFQISVARTDNMSTLSVMPLEFTNMAEKEGWVWDHFPPTPPLSTFSIGLLISDFETDDSVNVTNANGNYKVHFHHRQERYLNNMADATPKIPYMLEYMKNYTNTDYPLPTLNIVCLPKINYDIKINALGLIMVQEYSVNDNYKDFMNELPKQWINHMITPQTWNDFNVAELLAIFLINRVMTKSEMEELWIETVDQAQYAQLGVRVNYSNFENLNENSETRGEWFLKMLHSALTEKTMKTAIGNLMTEKMYSTFTEEMLWAAVTRQAHADETLTESVTVRKIADSWIHNNIYNYPVLNVIRDYEKNTAFLEQRLFINELPQNLSQEEKELIWSIPITYLSPENLEPDSMHAVSWMNEKKLEIDNLPGADSFIAMNPTDAGLFLVNYDQRNWENLINSASQLPTATRIKLLNDAMILASTEELDYITALNMSLMLINETEYPVWVPFLDQLQNIELFYKSTPLEDKLNRYLRFLLAPLFESLKKQDYEEDESYPTFYYTVTNVFYQLGYQPFIDDERKKIEEFIPVFTFNDTDTNLTLFCPEFMNISEDLSANQEQLLTYFNTIYNSRRVLERCMMKCPNYTEFIERILNGTLDEDMVFSTELWYGLVNFVTSTETSHNITFNFFLENFTELRKKFYYMKDLWSVFISDVTAKVRTEEGLYRLKEFYNETEKRLGYTRQIVETSIQEVTKVIEWNKKKMPEIEFWLDNILPTI